MRKQHYCTKKNVNIAIQKRKIRNSNESQILRAADNHFLETQNTRRFVKVRKNSADQKSYFVARKNF